MGEIHDDDLVREYQKIEPRVSLNPDETAIRRDFERNRLTFGDFIARANLAKGSNRKGFEVFMVLEMGSKFKWFEPAWVRMRDATDSARRSRRPRKK
jgi:hypothetical protein